MKKIVILLRRTEPTESERKAVREAFPDDEIEFRRADPADCVEHDDICFRAERETRVQPLVFLPTEGPIPSLAMKRGVAHVVLGPDGNLIELLPLEPKFKPFEP